MPLCHSIQLRTAGADSRLDQSQNCKPFHMKPLALVVRFLGAGLMLQPREVFMSTLLGSETTSFTLDNMGRYLCNSLQEALDSAGQTLGDQRRDFDVIVAGAGSFGSVIANGLFMKDATHSRRILVLESGPFVLPEHVQNLPWMEGDPVDSVRWVTRPG